MKNFFKYLIEATMSTSDALKVLGLKSNFTPDELKTAYKKAAVANHPDKGGDVYKMQQINVAKDLLSQPVTSNSSSTTKAKTSSSRTKAKTSSSRTKANDYDDDDDDYDYKKTPYPHIPGSYTTSNTLFRTKLKAEFRHAGDSEIRIPLKRASRAFPQVVIVLVRQTNMLGVEYRVRGLFSVVGGGMLKPLFKFDKENDARVFWESKASVAWFISNMQTLLITNTFEPMIVAKKIQELLKYYEKNQTKIDSNIRA